MLLTLLIYLAGLIGASRSDSYGGLMASRIIHAFASGVCEALPVQLVNDIFFRKCVSSRNLCNADKKQFMNVETS
jgi:predicted MFS family arabinose efflux permease